MLKLFLQQKAVDEIDNEEIEWESIYGADGYSDLAERLIDLINDDEIDTIASFYRVVAHTDEDVKVIIGV